MSRLKVEARVGSPAPFSMFTLQRTKNTQKHQAWFWFHEKVGGSGLQRKIVGSRRVKKDINKELIALELRGKLGGGIKEGCSGPHCGMVIVTGQEGSPQ